MTTFVYTWNAAFEAAPADSDNRSQGASQIRTVRVAVRERMAVDHFWDNTLGSNFDGFHQAVTMYPQTAWANTGGVVGNFGQLFCRIVTSGGGGTETELFWVSTAGNITQLTQNGAGVIPQIGDIKYIAEGGNTAGWIICAGGGFAAASYPGLFAVLGYFYGGGGSTFNVPTFPQINSTSAWIYAGYG